MHTIEVVWDDENSKDAIHIKEMLRKYGMKTSKEMVAGSQEDVDLRSQGVNEYDSKMRVWPCPLVVLKDEHGKIVWCDGNPHDNGILYAQEIMIGHRRISGQ